MMKKIFICTFNDNKIKELIEFSKINYPTYKIILLKEINKEIKDPIENGNTYDDNAKLKALNYKNQLLELKMFFPCDLVLSEDSGIEGLNTTYPGLHSKREVEKHGLIPVLKKLIVKNVGSTDVKYISSIVTIDYDDNFITRGAEEEGTLLLEPLGDNNYYLDRYFISKVRGPLGQLDPDTYLKTSFRLKAKIKD